MLCLCLFVHFDWLQISLSSSAVYIVLTTFVKVNSYLDAKTFS